MDSFNIYMSFFININLQSIKLILRNGKSMASVAIITHSLLSILMFLFGISIKSSIYYMSNSFMQTSPTTSTSSQDNAFIRYMLMFMALMLLIELAFIFAVVAIFHISSIATILISIASCTSKNLSFQDCFSMIGNKWKRPWTIRQSRTKPARYWFLVVFILGGLLWAMYPSTITFWMFILLGVVAVIFSMYSSVGSFLGMVVLVVEEGCDGKEALDKGEELASGHRVHGFLLNIFFNLVALIPFLGCWWIFGDKLWLKFPFFGLFMVNIFALVKMLATVEYTILYVECKKYHGQKIEVFGDLEYTKVPSDDAAAQV